MLKKNKFKESEMKICFSSMWNSKNRNKTFLLSYTGCSQCNINTRDASQNLLF